MSRAEQFREELIAKVKQALSSGESDTMADRIVDVFAAALDEIHASGGEIPDIKRNLTGDTCVADPTEGSVGRHTRHLVMTKL